MKLTKYERIGDTDTISLKSGGLRTIECPRLYCFEFTGNTDTFNNTDSDGADEIVEWAQKNAKSVCDISYTRDNTYIKIGLRTESHSTAHTIMQMWGAL